MFLVHHYLSSFAPLDCVTNTPIYLLKGFKPLTKQRRVLVYSSFTGAKAGMALFHIYRTEQTEVEFYVDVTVTNLQQKKIPTVKKLSVQDNIVCCQNLLLNQNIVKSHIFSAIQIKLRKYKRCHENARGNGSHSNSVIVPFSVDTQGNFCSVALLFLKSMAKLKFKNMPGDKRWPVKRSATPIHQ